MGYPTVEISWLGAANLIGARITYVVLGQSDRTNPAPDEFSARFIRSVSVLSGSGLTQSLEARLRIELGGKVSQ